MADQPHIIDDGFAEPEQVRKIFVGNLPYEADEGTRGFHVIGQHSGRNSQSGQTFFSRKNRHLVAG